MEWVLPTTSTPAAENKDRLYIYLENVRCYTDGSLVAPGGERDYHWSLVLAPKDERQRQNHNSQSQSSSSATPSGTSLGRGATGKRFQAKQEVVPGTMNVRYQFVQDSISLGLRGNNDGWPDMLSIPSNRQGRHPARVLTVRVLIAKTSQPSRLADVISRVPVRNDEADWDSEMWVKDVLVAIDNEDHAAPDNEPLLVSRAVGTEYWNSAWRVVRHRAWEFFQRAMQERLTGGTSWNNLPTHDLLTKKDVVR